MGKQDRRPLQDRLPWQLVDSNNACDTGTTGVAGDTGTWSIEGNTLCVAWAGENSRFSGCYSVEAQQGNHVRLVGPARWEGTLDR